MDKKLELKIKKNKYKIESKKHLQKLVNSLLKSKILTGNDVADILWVTPSVVSYIKNDIMNFNISQKRVEKFIKLLDHKL